MPSSKTSFESFASIWDEMTGEGERAQAIIIDKAMFGLLGTIKGKTIYEPVCGNGYLARQLVQKGAKEVWASDISESLIKKAKKKSKGITYLVQDGSSIKGLPHNYFDAVLIHDGIFYIKDLETLLKGMYTILKPGGILLFNALHPLFSLARNHMIKNKDKTVNDLIQYSQPYLKERFEQVDHIWKSSKGTKQDVHYWMYKRPISIYINECVKHHFSIAAMQELKTASKIAGKLKRSPIPSHYVIKAVKEDNLDKKSKL